MRIKHHIKIINMLYDEWDLGKISSKAIGKTCALIYWFEILSEIEKIVIEKDNNNIIGICGYKKNNSRKYFVRKNYYGLLNKILINSFFIKNKAAIIKYNNDYDYMPQKLKKQYDGEIIILLVDKLYRGKNIGKELLTKTLQMAKEDEIKKLFILCDESCNYKFYEKMNCKKVYEKLIPNSEPDKCGRISMEKGYVYEKVLNDDN